MNGELCFLSFASPETKVCQREHCVAWESRWTVRCARDYQKPPCGDRFVKEPNACETCGGGVAPHCKLLDRGVENAIDELRVSVDSMRGRT